MAFFRFLPIMEVGRNRWRGRPGRIHRNVGVPPFRCGRGHPQSESRADVRARPRGVLDGRGRQPRRCRPVERLPPPTVQSRTDRRLDDLDVQLPRHFPGHRIVRRRHPIPVTLAQRPRRSRHRPPPSNSPPARRSRRPATALACSRSSPRRRQPPPGRSSNPDSTETGRFPPGHGGNRRQGLS